MSVPIIHGTNPPQKEIEASHDIESFLESSTSQSAQVSRSAIGLDFSNFDGVVVVGGQIANMAYSQLVTDGNVPQIQQGDTHLDTFMKDGTPVFVIAGWEAHQTLDLVDKSISGGEMGKFIDMLPAGGEQEEEENERDEEPGTVPENPLEPDPGEERPDQETPHELRVRPPAEKDVVVTADYEIKFTGINREKADLEDGDASLGASVYGTVGASLGIDEDVYEFSGKISEVQSEKDIVLIINGEEYQYDSSRNKIGKPSDLLGQIGGTEEADRIVDSLKKKGTGSGGGEGEGISTRLLLAGGLFLTVFLLMNSGGSQVVIRD